MRPSFLRKTPIEIFITSFLFVCLLYRTLFLYEIYIDRALFSSFTFFTTTIGILDDCILSLVFFVIFLFISLLVEKIAPRKIFLRRCAIGFLFLLLETLALCLLIHKKTFHILSTGLDFNQVIDAIRFNDKSAFLSVLNHFDWLLLISPLFIFLYVHSISQQKFEKIIQYLLVPLVAIFAIAGYFTALSFDYTLNQRLKITYSNPVHYAFSNWYQRVTSYYSNRQDKPNEKQLHAIAFNDPSFVNPSLPPIIPKASATTQWNVLLIILESVGTAYLPSDPEKTPMPFLYWLSRNGLSLQNHYSSGNCSPLGLFGILSGIYPSPAPHHFELKPDINIPSIAALLKKTHTSLFITPGRTSFFFPLGLCKNNGFQEIYQATTMPTKNKNFINNWYAHEPEGFNFLLQKMENISQPFLITYYSGAAHFPYADYGPAYRLKSDINDAESRYINNLKLLDEHLKKTFHYLEEKKLLEHTIIVIVGDHGEGFKKYHADDASHNTALYQTQIKVPAIFYQPKLFQPKQITLPTSSVDILPTLLSAMAIPYNPNLMQGESLLSKPKRKYVFIYGDNQELAAIDIHNIKTKISFTKDKCQHFDLAKDPNELHPHACYNQETVRAILKFKNYQPAMLTWYNKKLLTEK